MKDAARMIVVSNRLPMVVEREGESYRLEPSSGGLVTALRPLLQSGSGVWIGWTGTEYLPEVEQLVDGASLHDGFNLCPVFLSEEERARFYCGFSNEILWPLFHDLQSRCNFDPLYWGTYLTVNEKFAKAVAGQTREGDFIWVHDYHLMNTAACLRKHGVGNSLGYFHHIPFPSPDIFEKLPWRANVLEGLLDFDLLGFQTPRDRRNFASCLRRFVKAASIHPRGDLLVVEEAGRSTLVGTFPISIDFAEFDSGASSDGVGARAKAIRGELSGCQMIIGIDRLDYTKGIPERLMAFRDLLSRYPELHRKVVLVQVVVPSREEIPRYAELKLQVQRMISEINGKYGQLGWVPIQYIHRSLERSELLAYYRAADIALITPLKDGMNLVAKEFCAAKADKDGVLILSEFAGAATQMHSDALLVNPYDARAVADAIHLACRMDPVERRHRMERLRRGIRRQDIYWWSRAFCTAARQSLDLAGSTHAIEPRKGGMACPEVAG